MIQLTINISGEQLVAGAFVAIVIFAIYKFVKFTF